MVNTISRSCVLPIAASTAVALARKPELMTYVLSPVLRIYRLDVATPVQSGTKGSGRFWWFGVLPTWTHHLTIETLGTTEIYTREHG